jgi:hypothetical protein
MADDDLLGKADALMARHNPARATAARYAEIPVLDEIVNLPAASDDLPLLTEYVEPEPADEAQTQALMASLHTALLAELQPRIDALIEERLQGSLAPLVEALIDELRGGLQPLAREILEDAILGAVEQELDRRKSGG